MPIKQPDYQLKLGLDLPEETESVNSSLSAEDVRIRTEAARRALEGGDLWQRDPLGNESIPAWYAHYLKLVYGGWPWRVAVLIAWLSMPKPRWPATQEELAKKVLGLSSDRQFSVWMAKNPAIAAQVRDTQFALVWDELGEVLAAGMAVAKQRDYKGKGDREMIYRMSGLLNEKTEEEIFDKTGSVDLSKLSFAEKLKLAGLNDPEALIALKRKLMEEQDEQPDDSGDES